MSLSYIRIAKTPEVDNVLTALRNRFNLLDEAEIIRFALSETYNKEVVDKAKHEDVHDAFYSALEEGGKIGDAYLAKKGIHRENMTEQELHDAVFDPPHDNA
jgi:hypothetical protein